MKRSDPYRQICLEDLSSPDSLMRIDGDHAYTDDMMTRVADSRAFSLGRSVVDLLDNVLSEMARETFFAALTQMRLPFERVWLDCVDGTAETGAFQLAGLFEHTPEGVRLQTMKFIKDRPIYTGTEILFMRDGCATYAETPVARIGNLLRARSSPGSADIERRRHDFEDLLRAAGIMAALSQLLERTGSLSEEPPTRITPAQRRKLERRGAPVPITGTTKIRLGELGRRHLAATTPTTEEGKPAKRAAHWVRGHMFLARNGRLTYRRPHIRGVGEVRETVRLIELPSESKAP